MGITLSFSEPYFSGTTSGTSEVPGRYDVAINGRGYQLDTEHEAFGQGIRTITVLREQADTAESTGEGSLNREGLWRRTMKSWHHGAGQNYWDREESDPYRFRSSKGVDVWEPWEIKALKDTRVAKSLGAGTGAMLAVAGSRLYMTAGNDMHYTTDITVDPVTTTTVTSFPAADATSITTDGYTVWTSHTASGIYSTNRGTSAAAAFATGNATLVKYVNGRLMAAYENNVYNVLTGGGAAMPAALFTHPNSDWRWTGFAEGPAFIYISGYSGDKSLIYKVGIKSDGTALDAASFVVAGFVPRGEIIRTIEGVPGAGLLIGTDDGFRFASFDDNGNLAVGPLVNIEARVSSFATYDKFAYFGWGGYDADNSGIGRMNVSVFTAPNVPAYASDLMDDGTITTNPETTSVVIFQGVPVFGVTDGSAANKIYVPDTTYVTEATLDSGTINFGLIDTKLAMYMDVAHDALPASTSVRLDLSVDDGTFAAAGTSSQDGAVGYSPMVLGQQSGRQFEVRTVLTSAANTPTVTQQTLRVYPTPDRARIILAPLLIYSRENNRGVEMYLNPQEEFNYFDDLITTRQASTYQELGVSWSVFVEDYQLERNDHSEDNQFWNHTLVLKMKVLPD